MNGKLHWFSRVTARPDVSRRQLVDLGGLDPYGQHQVLWKLFEVAQEERTERAEFLFRTEKKTACQCSTSYPCASLATMWGCGTLSPSHISLTSRSAIA